MNLRDTLNPVLGAVRAHGQTLARAMDRLPVARSTLALGLLSTAVGFNDAFAGLSYPSALVTGLVVPSVTAVSTGRIATNRAQGPEGVLGFAAKRALAHVLAVAIPLSLHATRRGWCAPWHDLTFLLLGPAIGILLAAVWGTAVQLLTRRFAWLARHRALAVSLALLAPIGTMLIGVLNFYRSPAVFAFNPFVGFFAGSLYDTGFDPTYRLLTYRLGSLGTLLGALGVLRHLEFDEAHRPTLRCALDRPLLGLGLAGLGLSVAVTSLSVSLGHSSTASSIRATLGDNLRVGRCDLVFSTRQNRIELERLGHDCDAWLLRLERRLGAPPLEQVTVFLFDSAEQKELLMGAAQTQIAKPWRREIYLNVNAYPDDVLGHELAHLVGGQLAPGPFAIAGSLHGLLPNPGLIEGLAVALAPDEDADLSPLQWARTLSELGQLPAPKSLFSFGFFNHSGRLAYTVAGAFVDYVGQRYGKRAVSTWYGGSDLETVTGTSWVELEQGFRKALTQVALPPNAQKAAAARFARQGVFSRHCPHAVDRTLEAAHSSMNRGDATTACRLFQQAQRLDPTEIAARFGLGECLQRTQQNAQARQQFESIAGDGTLPLATRQRAEEQLADLLVLDGQRELGQAIYNRIAAQTLESDLRRTLLLKADAESPEAVAALSRLLLGQGGQKAWDLAVRDLLRWSAAEPDSGTADYLIGRNFWQRGHLDAGVEHLDRALARTIELPEVRAEALRQRAILACAMGDKSRAVALANELVHNDFLPTPRRRGILSLVERCANRPAGDDWPDAPQARAPAPASAPKSSAIPSPVPKAPLPWDSSAFTCPSGMVKIPGSVFWMGSNPNYNSSDEAPRYQTKVRGFCLDQTEVTVAAYNACVAQGSCSKPTDDSVTCNGDHRDRDEHPINCVNYEQAETYCKQREGSRLPTELEWEFAARGGAQALKYPWGEGSPDGRACWKHHMTCAVKTYPPGAFDLYDLTGNVWEWTSSDYGEYPFSTPAFESPQKVYRGGSWSRRFEKWMHVGLRNRWSTRKSGSHLGFRCAKSPPLACAFGEATSGECLAGVLTAECPEGRAWNGARCARPNAPLCEEGQHEEPGHGCVRDIPITIGKHDLDVSAVKRQRSPEFDQDCRANQPRRPKAYRYSGGEHEARNLVGRREGCKNRDVGAGWNSACCP